MKSITVEMPHLTNAECGSIAVTAAEGGIGYWSQIEEYRPSRWFGNEGWIEVADDFVFYRLAPMTDDEMDYDWDKAIDITPDLIRLGFERGLDAPIDLGGWAVRNLVAKNRADWDAEVDATDADIIIQFGCFGELVYG